ncbi:MAG: hypothetical protein AABZ31_14930 [Bdellovibrionota bacterium]
MWAKKAILFTLVGVVSAMIQFFTSSAVANGIISPKSPFFMLTHDLVNCKTLKEQRGHLNRDDVTQKNVCILNVRCESRLKLNKRTPGPVVTDKAYCFPAKNNICPSAQFCATDIKYFKPNYIKYVVKPLKLH